MPGAILDGLRVIDISQGWAGPMITEILGDMGAEIVKIEAVQRLDWWRGVAPGAAGDAEIHERSPLFNGVNRNKYGITLNLAHPRGRELALDLVRRGDVFVSNFTTHVLEALHLQYEDLRAVNESIVMITMPAFGEVGPWRDYPALGTTVESMCGIQSITGYEGGPPRFQTISWDPVVGLHGLTAVLAALRQRRRTGVGQVIELVHIEAGISFAAQAFTDYTLNGRLQPRRGNTHPAMAPHGCYPAAGDDRWVVIAVRSDGEWRRFAALLNRPDLAEGGWATLRGRLAERAAVDATVAAWTRAREAPAIMETLQALGIAAGPVQSAADLLADPHLHARGSLVAIDRAVVGMHFYPAPVVRFSRTPATVRMPAPTLGEHNADVLQRVLGLSERDLRDLEAEQIIGTRPVV